MEKNKPPHKSVGYTTVAQILHSPDPDIVGSYYAMQRTGQAAIDLAIQTNTAIVTMVDGKIVRIPASELIKKRQPSV
ncbi:MAG: hypothetical protein B7Y05_17070 [Polynucleobacter sp. 24-46-87]|nr:MAG: hypothetical protein B7Y05_17070 [Polynucleobacter sp. 24-46-87]